MDILKKHQQKKKRRDRLYIVGFYTVLLFSFSLLVVSISDKNTICFTSYFCADSTEQFWKASFILYLYFLLVVLVLIQTYKWLEKLVAKKNHILYFKYLLFSLPIIISLIVWVVGTQKEDALLLIVFTAILSVLGLLMIEFRKK
jgi:hypothetical protein